MSALGFVLTVVGASLGPAWVASAATGWARPLTRHAAPATRVEVALALALAPALLAVVLAGGLTAPSLLAMVDPALDHCVGHEHHLHVCLWHGVSLPWGGSGVLGALAVVSGLRVVRAASSLWAVERLGRGLAAIGAVARGVRYVPASVPVCHVVGVVRPEVVVSRAVVDALSPAALTAVVAHEHAHLAASDARWSALLSLVSAAIPPVGAWESVWREAAEEVADDVAAAETDDHTVADALVRVARLRLVAGLGVAMDGGTLERRVLRLLQPRRPGRAARAGWGGTLLVAFAASVLLWGHEAVHHAIEEQWERISRIPVAANYYRE